MKKIFYFALAAMTLVACNKKDENKDTDPETPTTVTLTLEETTATVKIGETVELHATVSPAETAIAWTSNKEDIATVDDNGVVTGVAKGMATITATAGDASAKCIVAVVDPEEEEGNNMEKYLEGSNYYIFCMDETTFAKLGDKVKDDFRTNGEYVGTEIPEETTSVLQIWGNTLEGGDGGGLNSFGEEGYISLVTKAGDWTASGSGGIIQVHRSVDLSAITGDYKLVITYKTPASNQSPGIKFVLYGTKAGAPDVELPVAGNTAGEWVVKEYSMDNLFTRGLDWTLVWSEGAEGVKDAFHTIGFVVENKNDNTFGEGVDIDAVFIYQPAAEEEE